MSAGADLGPPARRAPRGLPPGQRLMIGALVLVMLGLAGAQLCPPEALAAGRADVEAMITELLEVTGARRVAYQVATTAGNEAMRRYRELPPAVAAKLLSALASAYNADALLASMVEDVRQRSSEERLDEALQLLRSPMASRMLDLEAKAESSAAASDLSSYASQIASSPVEAGRSDLIARLDTARGTSDLMVEMSIASLHGLMRAVNSAEPADRQMSPLELEQLRQAYRAQILPVIKDSTRTSALFTYRDEPDDALRQYVSLWETPDGQWVAKALSSAVLRALSEASERFARRLQKDLAELRASASTPSTTSTSAVAPVTAPASEAPPETTEEGPYWGKPVGFWIDRLSSRDLAPRLTAIEALQAGGAAHDSGVRAVVPALVPLLGDPDAKVRRAAAGALADLAPAAGLEDAIEPLEKGLDDPDAAVRQSAARGLGRFGSAAAGAAGKLTHLVLTDPASAALAAQALGAMGEAASEEVPVLMHALAPGAGLPSRWVIRALGELGPVARRAGPQLQRLRASARVDSVVSEEVNVALHRIGP